MGMMKKLKLCTSCTQNPRTVSFRATVNHGSGYHDPGMVGTPESWFTNLAELDELSSSLSISGESPSSCAEAVIRGAQQDHRLLFELRGETSSVLWAPQSVTAAVMDSHDPRADFKSSMEEMVDNLGMSKNDWEALEELLSWYLKVNEKSNHRLISATIHTMASPKDRGPGKNKRKWKEEEDDALIEVLKDLVNGGTLFKADNGFKPGFLNTVAEKLKAKLPESNLKAQPHVHSRLRHFKGIYNVVHDMVVGSCTSGFGWDPETKSVVAEKEVWKAYVKNHPKANDWRGKPCPYYEDLCIIFGKDRASGKDAQGPEEMEDEVNEERESEESSKKDELESSSTQEPSGVEASSEKSGNLGKRVRVSDNLVKGLSEVASILGREIRAASSNISRAIGFDVELSEKRSKLNEELANLGLTTIERHRAARKIASEPESVDVFFSIPDAERKEWVQALLRGDI